MTSTCAICGDVIESRIARNWHPGKLKRRAQWDIQAHLKRHSFADVLRFEIRQDLDQVPMMSGQQLCATFIAICSDNKPMQAMC